MGEMTTLLKFQMIEEIDGVYIYRYSRENDDLDGIISVDSSSKEIKIIQQSKTDENKIDVMNTIEMAYALIESNYPQKRTVMFY